MKVVKTFIVIDPHGLIFKKQESGELENLQKYVCGYIELLFMSNKWTVYVNEEGLLLRLKRNYLAEEILFDITGVQSQVYGSAIILGFNERSLTEKQVELIFSKCRV